MTEKLRLLTTYKVVSNLQAPSDMPWGSHHLQQIPLFVLSYERMSGKIIEPNNKNNKKTTNM